MQVIAVVSAAGGSGRTTLTAALAALLAMRGRRVLALDLDPRNSLGMQLGLPLEEADGWAPRFLAGGNWNQAAFRNSDGVQVVPFGRVPPQKLPAIEELALGAPDWLQRRLNQLALPDDAILLIDTDRLPSGYALQAINAAQVILNVLLPDAAAPGAARYAELAAGSRPVHHVVNQLEALRPLQHDLMQLLRQELGGRLASYSVHRDPAVPEAVASNRGLTAYAPNGQAAHDLQGLANWLLDLLGAGAHA
ncbi:MAG TPA: cellulose biosynthesis protein BcsQ [Nevskiaceae bacterium]|nr:cellulose biosynthesis protein BcsQ [Nevskiaceae bacterium]